MEIRLLIAYVLIGVVVLAALLQVRRRVLKAREYRRALRGQAAYQVAARKSPDSSVTQP